MTGSRLLTCFAALALSTSACGFFGSAEESSKETTDTTGGEIGANLSSPTTLVAVIPTRPPATRAPAPTTASCRPGDNSSEVRYDDVSVTLKVSTTCMGPRTDLQMTMTIANTSSSTVRYNPNQVEFFSIKPPKGTNKGSWRDRDCAPATPGEKQAATLGAGQSISFSAVYPGPAGAGNREACRRLENGAYDVHAVFVLCEGAAYSDGYCELSKGEQLFAQPVRINVDAA